MWGGPDDQNRVLRPYRGANDTIQVSGTNSIRCHLSADTMSRCGERERERERERTIMMCIISLNKKVHYKKRQNKTSYFLVDEHWSQWSTWGNCEPSGGKEGVSNRTRACGRLSVSNGNKKCPGSSVESKTCVLCRGMRIKFHAKFFLSIKLSFSMYLYLYMFI